MSKELSPQDKRDLRELAEHVGAGRRLRDLWPPIGDGSGNKRPLGRPPKRQRAVIAEALHQATYERGINCALIAQNLADKWPHIDRHKVRRMLKVAGDMWPWLPELVICQCRQANAKQGVRSIQAVYVWLGTYDQELAAAALALKDGSAISQAKRRFCEALPRTRRASAEAFFRAQRRRGNGYVRHVDAAGPGQHHAPRLQEFCHGITGCLLRGYAKLTKRAWKYNRLTVNWCFGPDGDGDGGAGRIKELRAITPAFSDMPSFSEQCMEATGFAAGATPGEPVKITVGGLAYRQRRTEPETWERQLAIENQTCPVCGTSGQFTWTAGKCRRDKCRFRWGDR